MSTEVQDGFTAISRVHSVMEQTANLVILPTTAL